MVHSHLLFAILTRAEPFASKWFSKQPSPPAKLVLELNLVAARKCEVWPLETTTFDLFSCAWGRPHVYLMFWYHTTVVDNIRHAQTMPRATVPVPEELRAKNCESCVSWLSIHLRTGKFKATMGTNILSLGPCILFHFFRCFTPPWHQTGVNSADMIGITEIVQLTSLLYMTCLWPKFVTQCAFTTCQATIPATRHCCRWLALVLLFIFYVHCLCPRLPKQHANISSKSHAPASPSPRASMEPMRGTICTLGMFSGHCLCASHASYLYPHLNMWQYFLQYVHLQYFFFHVTTCTMPRISSYTLQHGILTRAQVDDHTCWNFILPPLLHVCFLKGLWPWMGA